jgi:hypothetical protein
LVQFGPNTVLRTRRTLEYGSLTVLAFEPNCTQAGKPDLKRASVTVVIVRPEAERLWITGASERTGNTLRNFGLEAF